MILKKVLMEMDYKNVETSLFVVKHLNNIIIKESLLLNKIELDYFNSNIEITRLKEILRNNFKYGRFFEDTSIPLDIAQQRNENWIEDLAKAEKIIIGSSKSKIFGFMAFHEEDEEIELILGGVDESYAHYAYAFWSSFFLMLKQNKNDRVVNTIISASNIGVMNLYSQFGFNFKETYLGFHKHR